MKAAQSLPFRNEKTLAEIEARVLAVKKEVNRVPLGPIMAEIGELDRATRKRLRLEPSSTFFWNFMHEEIEIVGNTDLRLSVLAGIKHGYDFYSNFAEPGSVSTLRDQYRIRSANARTASPSWRCCS